MISQKNSLTLSIAGKHFSFSIGKEVYAPSDDSLLLADCVAEFAHGKTLDIGTGCGIQAIVAAGKSENVVAVDVSKPALECAMENAIANNVETKIELRKSNLFSKIRPSERFDTILFNPPYLPTNGKEKTSGILDAAWNGGSNGRKVIDRFLGQFSSHLNDGGDLLLLHCHLADTFKTIQELRGKGFTVNVLRKKTAGNEELCVLRASR